MKASEARNIAQSKIDNDHYNQYDKLITEIKHYAKGGFFEINVYEEILPSVSRVLAEDGYKINRTSDGRNGFDIKISWN